jgi:hypothetical protein
MDARRILFFVATAWANSTVESVALSDCFETADWAPQETALGRLLVLPAPIAFPET